MPKTYTWCFFFFFAESWNFCGSNQWNFVVKIHKVQRHRWTKENCTTTHGWQTLLLSWFLFRKKTHTRSRCLSQSSLRFNFSTLGIPNPVCRETLNRFFLYDYYYTIMNKVSILLLLALISVSDLDLTHGSPLFFNRAPTGQEALIGSGLLAAYAAGSYFNRRLGVSTVYHSHFPQKDAIVCSAATLNKP